MSVARILGHQFINHLGQSTQASLGQTADPILRMHRPSELANDFIQEGIFNHSLHKNPHVTTNALGEEIVFRLAGIIETLPRGQPFVAGR